jgi:hypothetical protein
VSPSSVGVAESDRCRGGASKVGGTPVGASKALGFGNASSWEYDLCTMSSSCCVMMKVGAFEGLARIPSSENLSR